MTNSPREALTEKSLRGETLQAANEALAAANHELRRKLDELSRAQEQLRQTTELLDMALDSAEMGWGVAYLETGELSLDARARAIAGFDPGEPLTMDDWQAIIHPDDLRLFEEAYRASLESGKYFRLDYRILRRDGQERVIRATGVSRPNPDGQHVMSGTQMDITERRQNELALRQLTATLEERVQNRTQALEALNADLLAAGARFRTLFDASPIPSAIYRQQDDTLVDANPMFLTFFGLPAEEILGRTAAELDRLFDGERRRAIAASVPAEGALRNLELELRDAAGQPCQTLVSLVRITQEGQPCILVSFIDVSDVKDAEAKIRRLASELTLAEQGERQRISTILHDDVQQRLYALQLLATTARARAGGDTTAAAGDLTALYEGLRQTGDLVRRLSVDLAPPILHGENLYHALLWLGRQMKDQFGLDVTIELLSPWRLIEQGVRILLFQVVRELLFNVTKHAGVSNVTVTLNQHDDIVTLEVRDDGAGFDAARVLSDDAGRTHGLAMNRQRMELYGGRLDIKAEPGRGTVATITLPVNHLYI